MYRIIYLLLLTSIVFAQQTVEVMTYNLLNYNNSTRDSHFRTVLDEINPDLLVVQEIISQAAVTNFLNNVLNYTGNEYAAGVYIDGAGTDNAVFYKSDRFDFLSNTRILTALRDINRFKLVYTATNDTFSVFSVHLKASQGTTNEQRRLQEVILLRQVTDGLRPSANFLVAGDFNIYHSNEPAYQALLYTAQGATGNVIDPIDRPGNWNNNAAFSDIHTQSTRVSGGGGAGGGLDDRFDMILISRNVSTPGHIDYVTGSYQSFGNDGNHFNMAINQQPNTAVSVEVANALHDASDHLPVLLELSFEAPSVIAGGENRIPAGPVLQQNYPNPFNPVTHIRYGLDRASHVRLTVYNTLGQRVAVLVDQQQPAGYHAALFDARHLAGGVYLYSLQVGEFQKVRKLILMK